MSEPSSLYMRVTLSEQNLTAFQHSRLAAPREYDDWRAWLASRKFYGTISDEEIASLSPTLHGESDKTVAEYIALLVADLFGGPSRAAYDAAAHQWTLCVMGLSENYKDFLEALAILRAAATYKDLPGDDFILIYPFFWEDRAVAYADAYVTLSQGSSQLVNEIPPAAVMEANQALDAIIAEFRAAHPDDAL